MKVFELFAGIGAPRAALKRAGILHQSVGFSEIDKYAIKSYCAIHGESELKNYGDITKIEELPPTDLLFHGSPCQSFSIAGKGLGGDEGSGTNSSLMWETVRLIDKSRPTYVIWENVKGVLSKKHRHNFDKYLEQMKVFGYKNYWRVLNTKHYGVPQNRERVFCISILKTANNGAFTFPKQFDNGIRLKHLLETNVAEKYYISDEKCAKLLSQLKDDTVLIDMCQAKREGFPREYVENSPSLQARDYKEPRLVKVIGNTNPSGNGMNGNVYAGDISPTVTTNKGEGHKMVVPIDYTYNYPQIIDIANCISARTDRGISNRKSEGTGVLECVPCLTPDRIEKRQNGRRFKEDGDPSFTLTSQDKHGVLLKEIEWVIVKEATKKGYAVAFLGDSINMEQPNSLTRRGMVGKEVAQTLTCSCNQAVVEPNECMMLGHIDVEGHDILKRVYDEKGISPTIQTCQWGNQEPKVYTRYRIRKLTPLECFRLQGFSDTDFQKAESVCSNSQLYKQAGNSITVDVLVYIFKQLFEPQEKKFEIGEQMSIIWEAIK